ncbi:MAG: hypothetical protein P8Z42_06230 [Anaerolineales bacterium]
MMFISIPAWIVVPLIQDGSVNAVEAIPFMTLCFVGLLLAAWFYKKVLPDPVTSAAL